MNSLTQSMFLCSLDPMCAPKAGSSSVPVVAEPAEDTRTKHLSFCIQYCNANKDWIIFQKQSFGVASSNFMICSKKLSVLQQSADFFPF